ncbi:TPA: hypothetical protein RRA74_003661 [Pseudomonas aeruginosa]|uniref:hypothetical protein n=1 Tax=Pseudomonadaceae TaxID=135621 RepID=UPI000F85BB55|nr:MULTISPECIES: hypothetical protein [Pseudomonas aeruginosa group]RUD16691.1 hypothetical protein IPC1375_29760 [Pseudomonas aeruginosa]HDY6318734.1 hypothetical protein [Pseudomonas aeruginosa]
MSPLGVPPDPPKLGHTLTDHSLFCIIPTHVDLRAGFSSALFLLFLACAAEPHGSAFFSFWSFFLLFFLCHVLPSAQAYRAAKAG